SEKIIELNNIASVSVEGGSLREKGQSQNEFAQGMEKLCLAMNGRPYTAVIIADNKNAWDVQQMRKQYQELYTALSPLQKVQISDSRSETESRSQSFAEMDGKQKAVMITNAVVSIAGTAAGVALGQSLDQVQLRERPLCWAVRLEARLGARLVVLFLRLHL
ncbi:MAG: hypothetical protein K2P65_14825, partial [Lachnospiraceae bacterium]|nr:hypothetical protein [Lachnospiraceae bacterium]